MIALKPFTFVPVGPQTSRSFVNRKNPVESLFSRNVAGTRLREPARLNVPQSMERQLDAAAGHLLKKELEARGIRVFTKANTKAILGDKKVRAVELEDGTKLPASLVVMFGAGAGYLGMSFIGAATGLVFGVAATFLCSLFVNAGNGAVYAMLPLIKRRLTGQIAGIVGAFGNVGGVLFLTFYSFVTPQTFFLAVSATAFIAWGLIYMFVEDPQRHIAEEMPDGTVTMIEVA